MQPNSKSPGNDLFISVLDPIHINGSKNNAQHTFSSIIKSSFAQWEWNPDRKDFSYNAAWFKMIGFKSEEFYDFGNKLDSIFHPEDLAVRQELLALYSNGKLPHYACELRVKGADGSWKWISDEAHWSGSSHYGQHQSIVGTSTDITDRKLSELAIRTGRRSSETAIKENTAALQQSMELLKKEVVLRRKAEQRISKALKEEKETTQLRSKIISCISHEFKTPLTTILSSTQLMDMINEMAPNPRLEKHLKQIESSVLHMNSMISDISFMEKMGIGQIILNKVKISVNSFLQDIIKEVGSKHAMPEVKIDIDKKVETIISDRKLLRQILRNLISNSVKYAKDDSPIEVSFRKHKKGFEFTVADQGVGIPKKEQSHIFEYFFRADNIGTQEGTGVGLAIVKSATEMLKGKVEFQSEKGVGTTFTISIPE